jgi:hypothetical protein
MPSPLLSIEQLKENADAEQAFLEGGRPATANDLDSVIARLVQYRDRRQKRCRGCNASAIARAERALKMRIPPAWQRVLRATAGLRVRGSDLGGGTACEIISPEQLPKFQQMQRDSMRALGIRFNRPALHVVDNGVGDFLFLETSRQKDGNCAVLLLSHETCRIERRWKDVQSMLDELLAGDA